MIDPLNIFGQIKEAILEEFPNAVVFAFGSRVKGESYDKMRSKFDFDIMVYGITEKTFGILIAKLDKTFKGKLDENNNQIKIDTSISNFSKLEQFKNNEYIVLL